jgi:hypothetical protein
MRYILTDFSEILMFEVPLSVRVGPGMMFSGFDLLRGIEKE